MIAVARRRLPFRLPGIVTMGAVAVGVLSMLGYGLWLLAAAVIVPVLIAILSRPQRGVLLLIALLPFHGLLILTDLPNAAWAWKEILATGVLGLTFAARPEIQGSPDRALPRWSRVLGALMAVAVVSAAFAPKYQAMFGLKVYFFYTLVALALWRCPFDAAERDHFVSILMGVGFVTAVYGIAQQVIGQWTLNSWGYEWGDQLRTTGPYLRSFSTFSQPFPFGYFLMLVIIVGVAVSVGEPGRLRSRLFFASLPVLGVALVFTFVRGAWLGTAVGLLYLAFRRHKVLVYGVPLVVVASLFLPGGSFSTSAFDPASLNERTTGWQRRTDVLLEAPLGLGTGATGAARERASLQQSGFSHADLVWPRESLRYQPDNWYVKVAFELGVLGLWLWIALVVSILVWSRRIEGQVDGHDGDLVAAFGAFLLATMVVSLISTFFEVAPMDVYFWIFVGIVATIAPAVGRRAPSRIPLRAPSEAFARTDDLVGPGPRRPARHRPPGA